MNGNELIHNTLSNIPPEICFLLAISSILMFTTFIPNYLKSKGIILKETPNPKRNIIQTIQKPHEQMEPFTLDPNIDPNHLRNKDDPETEITWAGGVGLRIAQKRAQKRKKLGYGFETDFDKKWAPVLAGTKSINEI